MTKRVLWVAVPLVVALGGCSSSSSTSHANDDGDESVAYGDGQPGEPLRPEETNDDPTGHSSAAMTSDGSTGWRQMSLPSSFGITFPGRRVVTRAGTKLFVYSLGTGALYDPTTDVWKPISAPPAGAPTDPAVIVWTGARVYMFGKHDDPTVRSGVSYDPVNDAWRLTPNAPSNLDCHPQGVWSPDTGDIFMWGCSSKSTLNGTGWRYRPSARAWYYTPKSPLSTRFMHTMAYTKLGKVIVFGGCDATVDAACRSGLNDAAVIDLHYPRTWTKVADAPYRDADHYSGMGSGYGWRIWGGYRGPNYGQATFWGSGYGAVFDQDTLQWTAIPHYPDSGEATCLLAATVGVGKLFFLGGHECSAYRRAYTTPRAYDFASASWTIPASTTGKPPAQLWPEPYNADTQALWINEEAVFWGGNEDVSGPPPHGTETGWIYHPGPGTSTCTPKTCADLGDTCGVAFDGCGNSLLCGSCPSPMTCHFYSGYQRCE